jgi:hypothetical protein
MNSTVAFIDSLLRNGEAVFREPPLFTNEIRPEIVRLLNVAHAEQQLALAGPPLEFNAEIALAAAEFVTMACWSLVMARESAATIERALQFPRNPERAQAHFSADICLRFLTTVYRRVMIRPADDNLHQVVVDVLRRWPLSGAASDVADPPIGSLEFDGHPGLQLLCAERLTAHLRPEWIPQEGRTREALELVMMQKGASLPALSDEGNIA